MQDIEYDSRRVIKPVVRGEMGPDALYGIVFVVRKQEIQQNGFGALGSQYALLAQQTFTDTGQLAIPVLDNQSEEITVITGYASSAPSYMVLDDVRLSTYAEQTYLTQTFDEDIAPWRNYVLEPDTAMLQPGEMAYDDTGQRLHITQGDFSIPGDGGNWMPVWAGAAAFSFAVEPGKHYRLKYDYQPGTVDTLTSMGGVNVLSTSELQMGGLFGAGRLYEQPSQNTGTTTTGILTINDTSMTILFYALSPQNLNATAGDFYIDNIVIEEVTEVACSDAEIQAYNLQNGKYRFGFNGMEKDDEVKGSGNSLDFGARIYDPRLGRWFSVDPMQRKYPDFAPYHFCLDNSILFVDPDGKVVIIKDVNGKVVATIKADGKMIIVKGMENSAAIHQYTQAKAYLEKKGGSSSLSLLEKNKKITFIQLMKTPIDGGAQFIPASTFIDKNKNKVLDKDERSTFKENATINGTILWNPNIGMTDGEGNYHSSALLFDHEAKHGVHFQDNALQATIDATTPDKKYDYVEEHKTIDEVNQVSKKLNNGDGGFGNRTSHGGTDHPQDFPTQFGKNYSEQIDDLNKSFQEAKEQMKKQSRNPIDNTNPKKKY